MHLLYMHDAQVVVTPGDSLTISFSADPASAVAVSFQQCGGDAYMQMDTMFNGTSVTTPNSITSKCTRVRGSSALLTDTAVFHDNLCAFQNSGTVADGYLEEDALLSSTNVDPDYITAEFYNPGAVVTEQRAGRGTERDNYNSANCMDVSRLRGECEAAWRAGGERKKEHPTHHSRVTAWVRKKRGRTLVTWHDRQQLARGPSYNTV